MTKISLNILPALKKWFVEKANVLTVWNTTASDSQIPSEKLVKTELDAKAVKSDVDIALNSKFNKSDIKTVINNTLTDNDIVSGKAVFDEIKKVESGIPSGMTHSDITDWDTATSGFEKGANKATSLASPDDTKYPTTKAVNDAITTVNTNVGNTYATKTALSNGLAGKIDTSAKISTISSTSTNAQIPDAKAVYDLYDIIPKWKVEAYDSVSALPSTGVLGTIYLVSNESSGSNHWDEYFWSTADDTPGYEKFGGLEVDVSNFITMKQVTDYIGANGSLALSDSGELSLTITDAS